MNHFEFSSAFKTLGPLMLWDEAQGCPESDIVDRPQYLQSTASDMLQSNSKERLCLQKTLTFPAHPLLYTANFICSSGSCHLQKFLGDSCLLDCSREEE